MPKQVPKFQIVPKAVHVFYNILNLVAINAWVIYKDVTLWQLAKELGDIYENEDESTSTLSEIRYTESHSFPFVFLVLKNKENADILHM